MTWIDLAKKIDSFTDEQKNTDVTIFDKSLEEFFPTIGIDFSNEKSTDKVVLNNLGVLDDDHPFLIVW